jgi:hypothetical protein
MKQAPNGLYISSRTRKLQLRTGFYYYIFARQTERGLFVSSSISGSKIPTDRSVNTWLVRIVLSLPSLVAVPSCKPACLIHLRTPENRGRLRGSSTALNVLASRARRPAGLLRSRSVACTAAAGLLRPVPDPHLTYWRCVERANREGGERDGLVPPAGLLARDGSGSDTEEYH